MCYAYPGPRCTPHAREQLQVAQEKWDSAKDNTERGRAMEILKSAQLKYDATVGGQKELEQTIADKGDPTGAIALRLDRGKEDRTTSLALIKSKERGDQEEGEHINYLTGERRTHVATLNKDPNRDPRDYIDSIAPLEDFRKAAENGKIDIRHSDDPNTPYAVLDYSRSAQYEKDWNAITIASRGLIIDTTTGEIKARPFKKFFNDNEPAGEYNTFPRTGPVVVADKLDGSLGIGYKKPDGTYAISTRGSMNSSQAKHASAVYAEKYAGKWEGENDEEHTYMFEIIHPENRIVLDYGETDDLVLLGAVNKKTGRSVPVGEVTNWKGPKAKEHPYGSYTEALSHKIADDEEGVVVHFTDSDERVKFKGEEYIRLHKVATGVTAIKVWESVSKGDQKEIDGWVQNVPDEFADPIKAKATELRQKKEDTLKKLYADANNMKKEAEKQGLTSRKDTAMYMLAKSKENKDPRAQLLVSAVFTPKAPRLDTWAWKHVRPVGKEQI